MFTTLLGAGLNIILDPIFLFVCKWGMAGAAVVTVLGQIATAGVSAYYLFHLETVKMIRRDFQPAPAVLRKTLALGVCSFLAQISLVATMATINNVIRTYASLDSVFSCRNIHKSRWQ